MITVISGTNRPGSNTRKISNIVHGFMADNGIETQLLDLSDLPLELYAPSSYAEKPAEFDRFQKMINATDGIMTVVPEYNGSFPGAVKYFIDMLAFPESLYEKPAGFIGISSGRWGAVRAVEQLEMVFQYRHAHLFGRRCFVPFVGRVLDEAGRLTDPDLSEKISKTALDFAVFCGRLG